MENERVLRCDKDAREENHTTLRRDEGTGMNAGEILQCNGCGKTIVKENGMYREGLLTVEQEWGYFSAKDGERHSFCLCEKCYDKLISNFVIPVIIEDYL